MRVKERRKEGLRGEKRRGREGLHIGMYAETQKMHAEIKNGIIQALKGGCRCLFAVSKCLFARSK